VVLQAEAEIVTLRSARSRAKTKYQNYQNVLLVHRIFEQKHRKCAFALRLRCSQLSVGLCEQSPQVSRIEGSATPGRGILL
jgi:hypothetical protein